MATPKKKISRSRRNMRRFAAGNQLEKTTLITSAITGEVTRPHRVTLASIDAYVAAKKAAKSAGKKTKSASAKA